MTITDEIVETACIACAVSAWPEGWKYAPEHQRAILRVRMHAALEAVAPAIRAAALEEAAGAADRFGDDEVADAIRALKGDAP